MIPQLGSPFNPKFMARFQGVLGPWFRDGGNPYKDRKGGRLMIMMMMMVMMMMMMMMMMMKKMTKMRMRMRMRIMMTMMVTV